MLKSGAILAIAMYSDQASALSIDQKSSTNH